MIALLISNSLQIIQAQDLKPVQEFKNRKVSNFCLNMAVYRVDKSDSSTPTSQTDQICIATADKLLYFYEADFSSGILNFKEDTTPPLDKGYYIGFTPVSIIWDGDRVYLASKRSYTIMSKKNGEVLAGLSIETKEMLMMSVFRDKFLITTNFQKKAQFMV